MEEDKSVAVLEELRYFRWILYHHSKPADIIIKSGKDSSSVSLAENDDNEEIIGSVIRYHCEHNYAQQIAEEIAIANFDMNKVST